MSVGKRLVHVLLGLEAAAAWSAAYSSWSTMPMLLNTAVDEQQIGNTVPKTYTKVGFAMPAIEARVRSIEPPMRCSGVALQLAGGYLLNLSWRLQV